MDTARQPFYEITQLLREAAVLVASAADATRVRLVLGTSPSPSPPPPWLLGPSDNTPPRAAAFAVVVVVVVVAVVTSTEAPVLSSGSHATAVPGSESMPLPRPQNSTYWPKWTAPGDR